MLPSAGAPPEEGPAARDYRLSGFISRPQYQKLNRNSIFLFVNGRLIRDKVLMHAISSAYHNLMPPACYPFALLFLECDFEDVDVNVHPCKTEVRFRHGSFVHDFVRDSIREILMESKPVSALPAPSGARAGGTPQPGAALPFSEFSQRAVQWDGPAAPSEPASASWDRPPGGSGLPQPRWDGPPGVSETAPSELPEVTLESPRPAALRVPDTHGEFPVEAAEAAASSLEALAELRPLGQLHESFIIAAGRDGLWIVDQHVAHERVLFEKVMKEVAAGRVEVQRLLLPLVLELTAGQQIEYARIAGELQTAGFETEPFGRRTIAVKAAPAGVSPGGVQKLLYEILDVAESELRGLSLADVRRAMAASIACHAAIKVNTRLDQAKMAWLLQALAATDCPMTCPHGRPIALRYSTRDILRSFHRI